MHSSYYPYSRRLAGLAQPVLKKTISEKLGIPVLVLKGDLYDSRNYSAEQPRIRVESFAEMLKMAIDSQEGLISCLTGMELVAP